MAKQTMSNVKTQEVVNTKTFPELLQQRSIINRFESMLGDNSGTFLGALLTVYNNNSAFKNCDPRTILSAATMAASLRLPITPSLGYAYIIPYGKSATFQVGYKGFIQLAMRSNQYRKLNAGKVFEGQIKEIDFITGDVIRGEKISDRVIGYIAYMELINGFNKTLYMTLDEIEQHAKKYSQGYSSGKGSVWKSDFDKMAMKTVMKLLISRYGIVSIDSKFTDMARALAADQGRINPDGTVTYVDNKNDTVSIPFESSVPFETANIDDLGDNSISEESTDKT